MSVLADMDEVLGRPASPRAAAIDRRRPHRLKALRALILGVCAVIGLRGAQLVLWSEPGEARASADASWSAAAADQPRAAIVDRNGALLAANVETYSLWADPQRVIDPVETAKALAAALPELDAGLAARRMGEGRKRFVWIERNLTPRQRDAVFALGLPGLDFRTEIKRVYPRGRLAGHVLGFTDRDNRGMAGVEAAFDARLAGDPTPLRLSLDLGVQHLLEAELASAAAAHAAQGGAGVILDARTGEIRAMASFPAFDPNRAGEAGGDAARNRALADAAEYGSVFKAFTAAMAIDAGIAAPETLIDISEPGLAGAPSLFEASAGEGAIRLRDMVRTSSNAGAARLALALGPELQESYLGRFGLLEAPRLGLPETAPPRPPVRWGETETATLSYGYGLAASPLAIASAYGVLANEGHYVAPSLLAAGGPDAPEPDRWRAISPDAARAVTGLLRDSVVNGTGKKADAPGYYVAGKTGTALKWGPGGYDPERRRSSFAALFPAHAPRYVVFVTLDEPQPTPETNGFASAGWTAAPLARRVIERAGPALGLEPVSEGLGGWDDPRSGVLNARSEGQDWPQ